MVREARTVNSELSLLAHAAAVAAVRELQNHPAIPRVWVSPEGAAEYLSVSARILEDWRRAGTGPAWHRAGGRLIRYRLSDVDAWVEAQREGQ